jgi:hypothetical protein
MNIGNGPLIDTIVETTGFSDVCVQALVRERKNRPLSGAGSPPSERLDHTGDVLPGAEW